MEFQHVYGPVPSRRLGRSLGVNPIPSKTCNYSCVYCQLGRTSGLTNTRQDFFPPEQIMGELREALRLHADDADYVTFVGEGEPTLCASLGKLIKYTKQISKLPVAVVTNGSLLYRSDVRQALADADVVMPSLDAADQMTYQKINRPHGTLRIAEIIDGMARFRQVFEGQLWVEVMLVRGVNDGTACYSGKCFDCTMRPQRWGRIVICDLHNGGYEMPVSICSCFPERYGMTWMRFLFGVPVAFL